MIMRMMMTYKTNTCHTCVTPMRFKQNEAYGDDDDDEDTQIEYV